MRIAAIVAFSSVLLVGPLAIAQDAPSPEPGALWAKALADARTLLVKQHGEVERARIERGLTQTLRLWRADDGDAAAWQRFVTTEFIPQGALLDATFERLEFAFERLDGYFVSLGRDWRWGVDVEQGPMLPLDERLASWDPSAHVTEDLFANQTAFVVLLNFESTGLQQRIKDGPTWSRRRWAETRLSDRFVDRLPGEVRQNIARALAQAETYINGYYVRMDRVLYDGKKIFPEGKRLITHWNLRDEIKAQYGAPDKPTALLRQRALQRVMDAIVRQTIPAAAIDSQAATWDVVTGAVDGAPAARENDQRYERWLGVFHAVSGADPYDPDNPTFIDRRFNRDRELPLADVEKMLTTLLESPLASRVAAIVRQRLGRPLEPFDIWYAGFKPSASHDEVELDRMTKQRYPTAAAFAADIPRILQALGFSPEQAAFIAARITVDPSRGAGHALGMGRRDDLAHLRTLVKSDGMDYKGYNIAVHELGHNVEQVYSTAAIDHTLLAGVPNNAFTEAMAFLFQAKDLELLGVGNTDPSAQRARVLEEFWATREIAGVSLVDIRAWQWLYANREATPAQFREAVVTIAQDVWNKYYAPLFGQKDIALLGVYSHLIQYGLYLPDYTIGHLIAFQIEEHFTANPGKFGAEWERIAKLGRLTPDLWMRQAVGNPLSPQPLLRATEKATDATVATKEKPR